MNYVKYQSEIKGLLDKKSGIYLFSREQKDKTFKFGMSEAGLFSRLRQHKSCYPFKSEYWLQMIILTDNKHTRILEKTFLAETKTRHTITVEDSDIKEQGNRPREYRVFGNRTEINTVVRNILNEKKNRDQWQYCIVFSENSWKILKNISLTKSVSLPVDNVGTLSPLSARISTRPPIEPIKALPYKESEVDVKGELKVKGKIKTKWGVATITKIISKDKVLCKWKDYDGEYVLNIRDA